MATLYLTWSPWHYSGQNYGISLMFLRRNGVAPSPLAKRVLYTSFILSFAVTALLIHQALAPGSLAAVPQTDVQFVRIGFPSGFVDVVLPIVLVLYASSVALAGWLLVRAGSVAKIAPAALLMVTQAAWFVLPFAGVRLGWIPADDVLTGPTYVTRALLWAAVAHSAQYLWITSYYARHSSGWTGSSSYLWKALLAGSLAWTVPLVVAPATRGISPFAAGLPLLLAAVVNLHHFVLDGAIWKLRGGAVASILIRSRSEEPQPVAARRAPWRPLVWGAAAVCLLVQGAMSAVGDGGFQLAIARGHTDLADSILTKIGWLGVENASKRMQVGIALRHQGQKARALAEFRRAVEIAPDSPFALRSIGEILGEQGDFGGAVNAYRQAVAVDPASAPTHIQLANALLRTHQVDEAALHLRRALALQPDLAGARGQLDAVLSWQRGRRRGAALDDPIGR